MTMMDATSLKTTGNLSRRARAQDIDRYVGDRIRERRIMLGLTQQQLAEMIGVTYQQAHKYEKGVNRMSAGRLFTIAEALGVDIGYFFDDIGSERTFKPTPQQRMLLELSRNFISISNPKHRDALCHLARGLVTIEPDGEEDHAAA